MTLPPLTPARLPSVPPPTTRDRLAALMVQVRRWGPIMLLAIGYAIPRWFISSGVEEYSGSASTLAVAQAAYGSVWELNDNPVGWFLFPGARVRRVWSDPGHCPPDARVSHDGSENFRAEVRTFSWFGIPGPIVEVTCGGWSYGVQ